MFYMQDACDSLGTLTCSAQGRRESVVQLSDVDHGEQVY